MTRPLTDSSPAALLPHVRTIAHEAGQVILRFYNDRCDVSTKADGSPVSQADHAAESVILPALRHLTPDLPIVAEESCATHGFPELSGPRFWLVDPLDGTKEFISRNGEFTVNIALIENGAPVLGVVYAPVTGDLYAASGPGTAVHWQEGRHDHAIRTRTPPEAGLTVVASRSHGSPELTDAFLAGFTVAERISCGSSLKFCALACGRADLYPRFGPTMEWDTAAGHAVLSAAGGRVETPEGAPLLYGKADFRNSFFIAHAR
ncbi:3'(2'),5'-bisphosphate nucleotidase CysQ [Azospirillum oleiclasticum]|uniref:3'(2'),5'-bisphosphate nucleotidase CysQ n=1 Tax=Azospirillum oleiclasticum TaxID=2735135 RepID=UPI001FE386D5|nr:3'(2'),5'-bisphosphate nucleotidase CysQ [Azospirillum oleiclasticum]